MNRYRKLLKLYISRIIYLVGVVCFLMCNVSNGQTVRYRIATNGSQNYIYASDSTAYLGGNFTAVGRPTNGLKVYSSDSGVWKDSLNVNVKSSIVTRAYRAADGGYAMSGKFYYANGEKIKYDILIVKPNGSIDHQASKGIVGGQIQDFIVYGDTLIATGSFSSVGSVDRNNLFGLNIRTGKVLDWAPNILGRDINLYQTEENVVVSGDDLVLNGQRYKSTIFFEKKTLTTQNVLRLKTKIQFLTEDSTHIYLGGESIRYSKVGVIGNFVIEDLDNGVYSKFPDLDNASSIICVDDDKGGAYLGAPYSKVNSASENYIVRIDSNLQLDSSFNLDLDGVITGLEYRDDTLFISGAFRKANNVNVSQLIAYVVSTKEIVQFPFYGSSFKLKSLGGSKFLAYRIRELNNFHFSQTYSKAAILDYKTGDIVTSTTEFQNATIANDTIFHIPSELQSEFHGEAFMKIDREGKLSAKTVGDSYGTGLCIADDKKGGYFLSGWQFEYNTNKPHQNGNFDSYIAHVLPDGLSDEDFNIYTTKGNKFNEILLFGDTLFVCGEGNRESSVFDGISAVSMKTKKVIKNDIGGVGEVLKLYNGLLYTSREVINPRTFTKQSLNLYANSYANSDSFVYFKGRTNVRGTWEHCLSRIRKIGLTIDTSFFFVVTEHLKEILLYKDKIIIAPHRNYGLSTINGHSFNSITTIDINTKQIDSLNIKLEESPGSQRVNVLYERNDTLYIGGKINMAGIAYPISLLSYDLVGNKILDKFEKIRGEVYDMLIDDEINLVGFRLRTNYQDGVLHAFDAEKLEVVHSFSPPTRVPGYGRNVVYAAPLVDNNSIYCVNNYVLKRGADSSKYIHRFKRKDLSYQDWSVDLDDNYQIRQLTDMGEDLLMGVSLKISRRGFRKLIPVSKSTGLVGQKSISLGGDGYELVSFQGKPLVLGDFDLLNEKYGGSILKINKNSREVSVLSYIDEDKDSLVRMKHHQSELFLFTMLKDESKAIYCLSVKTDGSKIDTVCVMLGDENIEIEDVHFKNDLLYLTGGFDSILVNQKMYERLGGACVNFNQKTIEPWDPQFYKAPQILDVTDSYVYTLGEVGALGNVITNSSVINYSPKSGEYKSVFNPDSITSNSAVYSFGDTLIIVDRGRLFNDTTAIYFYNKRLNKLELTPWEISYPFSIYDVIKKDNIFYVAGQFSEVNTEQKSNFFAYDIAAKSLVSNTPNFYGDVYDLLSQDSLIYAAGIFGYVDSKKTDKLAAVNIKSNEVKTFSFGFLDNTEVYSINVIDSICFLVVRNLPDDSKGVFSFNLNSDTAIDIPFEFPFGVMSLTQLSDKIVISASKSHLYNFKTGKPHPFLSSLGIRSDKILFFDTTALAVSNYYDVSNINNGRIAEIAFPSWFAHKGITDNYPKFIGQVSNFEMVCSGNNIDSSTNIYFVQNSDTLWSDTSSYTFSDDNTFVYLTLDSTIGKLGVYDLVQELSNGDVSTIQHALNIELNEEHSIVLSIEGRNLIRSNQWTPYSIRITNNSNIERKLIPIIVSIDTSAELFFEVSAFSDTGVTSSIIRSSVDSVGGVPRTVNVYGLMIPQLSAYESINIPIRIRKVADTVKIEARVLGALQSNLHYDSKIDEAYSTVFSDSLSTSCLDSLVLKSWNQRLSIGSSVAFSKPRVIDYSTFIADLSICGSSSSYEFNELSNLVLNGIDSTQMSPFLSTVDMETLHNGKAPFTFDVSSYKVINVVNSYDPNVKIGKSGVGNKNYMKKIPKELVYHIHFENDSSASAPLHKLLILDTLDIEVLDPSTLRFEEVIIGKNRFVLNGLTTVNDIIGKNSEGNAWIYCVAEVLPNGVVLCKLEAYELNGYAKMSEPLVGFLPPNRHEGQGQGVISFSIKRRDDAKVIDNRASVYFDNNEVIHTPMWHVTLDDDLPESKLEVIDYSKGRLNLRVKGSDGSSGLKNIDIFYSTDKVNYKLLISAGLQPEVSIAMLPNRTIYLYSIAIDSVGYREARPNMFDDSIFLSQPSVPFSDYFSIFPNPSNGNFNIYSFFESNVEVDIYNLEGKKVFSSQVLQLETKEVHLDARGLYFVRFSSSSGKISYKRILTF